MIRPPVKFFVVRAALCGSESARTGAIRPATTFHPRPMATVFGMAGRPVLPLSFGSGRGHAHDGGARNRWRAARMSRTVGPVTAPAWRTTRAPILIGFSRRPVSDRSAMASGSLTQRVGRWLGCRLAHGAAAGPRCRGTACMILEILVEAFDSDGSHRLRSANVARSGFNM